MISIVLATYNEEKNIERCLLAVKNWADEIIVVDGESLDNTRELAKKHGARVIKTTNKPNFHINKQIAIDAAKGNLILQLDADEVVDADLAMFIQEIHQHLNNHQDLPSAWWVKRQNLFLGKFLTKGGQYPDPVIRLFIKGKAELPQKDVHEQMRVDGETGWAMGHLIHYANPSFSDYLRKFNTYTSFKANQLLEQNLSLNFQNGLNYLVIKPFTTWFSIFLRHRGYVDGIPGFVFAVMSGLHHCVAYLKLWELKIKQD
jgi:glycosyltransferase involved in cell wall biosynthesis